MASLLLGPLLRYVGRSQATVWVETDRACTVEVLGRSAATFEVYGHHYALVAMEGLDEGAVTEYSVQLDGDPVWPLDDSEHPPSAIHTREGEHQARLVFGSCRVGAPQREPYTLSPEQDEHGYGTDALWAYSRRLRAGIEPWPDALLLIGDQVYADEVSPETLEFIRSRRDTGQPPGEEIADFEEYTRLYREAWSDPDIRWLLSTVPSVMVFDDHDVIDDWNISWQWLKDARAEPWWHARITGAFPEAWLEDPALTQSTSRVLEPHRGRITWDAGIHEWSDVEALPVRPKCLNCKPSRFGSVKRLFDFYDACAREGIALYGGGQFELGPGRGQIQLLASLFHADAPNDVAPGDYNAAAPVAGLPEPPLPIESRVGFR